MVPENAGRRSALFVASCALAVLSSGEAAGAGTRITIRIYPHVAEEPARVRVTVDVPPRAENRSVTVGADSGTFQRSSTFPLAGARASRIHEFQYDGLPAGEYVVNAALFDVTGQIAFDEEKLTVTSDDRGDPRTAHRRTLPAVGRPLARR
jgi:hypothetical protein